MKTSIKIKFYVLLLSAFTFGFMKTGFSQDDVDHTADWMRHVKFGIMVHYLETLQNAYYPHDMGKTTSWDSCVNDFDANLFASQLHKMGADYVIFTLYQGTKYLCAPSESYERITGYKRGEATSHRDLIMDISNALQPYHIKLFLYITGDGTYRDDQANRAFSNPMLKWKQNGNKFIATGVFVNKWAGVIQEFSMRYGKRISGWWVDGAFDFHGYNDQLLGILYRAMKSGNPDAVVAFNRSPKPTVTFNTKLDDYTAAEMNTLTDYPPAGGRINGKQWHIVSYLGTDWKSPEIRYTKKYMVNYINKVNSLGGVVTVNCALFRNGSIAPAQVEFMKLVSEKIQPR